MPPRSRDDCSLSFSEEPTFVVAEQNYGAVSPSYSRFSFLGSRRKNGGRQVVQPDKVHTRRTYDENEQADILCSAIAIDVSEGNTADHRQCCENKNRPWMQSSLRRLQTTFRRASSHHGRRRWPRNRKGVFCRKGDQLSKEPSNVSVVPLTNLHSTGKIATRSSTLTPSQVMQLEPRHRTWYFSSNHVLVNRERLSHGLIPYHRSVDLDVHAKKLLEEVMTRASVARSSAGQSQGQLGKDLQKSRSYDTDTMSATSFSSAGTSSNLSMLPFIEEPNNMVQAANLLVGKSIQAIHDQTMLRSSCGTERANILNTSFKYFGMATHKDPSTGLLYLCQLFGTERIAT